MSSPGVRVEHKPNGTTHISQEGAPTAASDSETNPPTPGEYTFAGDMHNLNQEPRKSPVGDAANAFKYLAMSMTFTINGADTFWFLPPIGNPDILGVGSPPPTSSYFVYDNQFFPLDLYDGTSGWRFTHDLVQGTTYSVEPWSTGVTVPFDQFPSNPNGVSGTIAGTSELGGIPFGIQGYMRPNQIDFVPLPWVYI